VSQRPAPALATPPSTACHPKLSVQSYNRFAPFTPAVGLVSATFATSFTPGPEQKPWDGVHGYQTIRGVARIDGTVFSDFNGPFACGTGNQTVRPSVCCLRACNELCRTWGSRLGQGRVPCC
jgi:hypothetical protein